MAGQKAAEAGNMRMPGARTPRSENKEKASDEKQTLLRLIRYFSGEYKILALLFLCVAIMVVCSVYAPMLQSSAVDVIAGGNYRELPRYLSGMVFFYAVGAALSLLQGRFSAGLSQRIVKQMREDLFHKIMNLPVRYLDQHPHGDIMSRMTNDIENISNTVSQSLGTLLSGILTIIGTVAMMFFLCPELTLVTCLIMILTIVFTKCLSAAMRKSYRERQALLGDLNSTVEEMVTGYRTVTAYNRQEAVIRDFEQTADELTKAGIRAEILGGAMGPVMNCINNIGFVMVAVAGGFFALRGIISVGVISAFIVYARQFGRPLDELANIYGQIQTAIAGAERVFAIMDEPEEKKTGAYRADITKGEISFRNVCFSYTAGTPVLRDFTLDVKAGQKIALVGATGSGKTTVVNLLMRFYTPDSGAIRIDGVDIRDMECEHLRKNTAIVLQDTVLFEDTVENNIKYSRPDAGADEVERAVKLSHCCSMIQHLKKGYETVLSPSGQNLSQGQRQLLAIARAFLADSRILILDEATSSIDTRTEKYIQDAMAELMKNRTSLIIAHRLSTIRDADRIVVMEQGRIVEMGNHEELLAKKGHYYELYMAQFEGNRT